MVIVISSDDLTLKLVTPFTWGDANIIIDTRKLKILLLIILLLV